MVCLAERAWSIRSSQQDPDIERWITSFTKYYTQYWDFAHLWDLRLSLSHIHMVVANGTFHWSLGVLDDVFWRSEHGQLDLVNNTRTLKDGSLFHQILHTILGFCTIVEFQAVIESTYIWWLLMAPFTDPLEFWMMVCLAERAWLIRSSQQNPDIERWITSFTNYYTQHWDCGISGIF
jgi:hypothetical protein